MKFQDSNLELEFVWVGGWVGVGQNCISCSLCRIEGQQRQERNPFPSFHFQRTSPHSLPMPGSPAKGHATPGAEIRITRKITTDPTLVPQLKRTVFFFGETRETSLVTTVSSSLFFGGVVLLMVVRNREGSAQHSVCICSVKITIFRQQQGSLWIQNLLKLE